MSIYDMAANQKKFNQATADISKGNVKRTDWIGFLDALGWMENSGSYAKIRGSSFHGIYQVGGQIATDLHFFDTKGVGGGFLGANSWADLERNPVAQELFGLMMFAGIPNVTGDPRNLFSSKYTATRKAADLTAGFSSAKFDQMVGKTFTVNFNDASGKVIAAKQITFSQAAIDLPSVFRLPVGVFHATSFSCC